MEKRIRKTKKRDALKAATVEITADITGVTKRSVQRVRNGDQNNEHVFETYMNIKEGFEKVIEENKLLAAVERLVPFNKPNKIA